MARSTLGADAAVRRHILAERITFREMYGRKDIGKTADGRTAWDILSGPVDVVLEGGDVQIRRFELPDDHPARLRGHPCDYVVLGSDDIVRERR